MFVERRPPLYALPKRMIATSSRLRLVREPVGAAAPPPRCLRLRLTLRARLPLSPAFPYVTRLIHSPTATSWSPKGAFRSSQTSAPLTIGSVHRRPRRLSNRAQNLDADPSVQRGFQLLLFTPPR